MGTNPFHRIASKGWIFSSQAYTLKIGLSVFYLFLFSAALCISFSSHLCSLLYRPEHRVLFAPRAGLLKSVFSQGIDLAQLSALLSISKMNMEFFSDMSSWAQAYYTLRLLVGPHRVTSSLLLILWTQWWALLCFRSWLKLKHEGSPNVEREEAKEWHRAREMQARSPIASLWLALLFLILLWLILCLSAFLLWFLLGPARSSL